MRKWNKTQLVIRHLKQKGSITSWDAIRLYGATRLSAIIFNLRDRGYLIDSIWLDGKDRFGNPGRYVKYIFKGLQDGFQENQ